MPSPASLWAIEFLKQLNIDALQSGVRSLTIEVNPMEPMRIEILCIQPEMLKVTKFPPGMEVSIEVYGEEEEQ